MNHHKFTLKSQKPGNATVNWAITGLGNGFMFIRHVAITWASAAVWWIETVSPEGTFCDTVQIPSSVGDMELI